MAATVTEDGQVAIPKSVRDLLGIGPGDAVEFLETPDGKVVIAPVGKAAPVSSEKRKGRFTALLGHAGPGPSTDEIMALTRGD